MIEETYKVFKNAKKEFIPPFLKLEIILSTLFHMNRIIFKTTE